MSTDGLGKPLPRKVVRSSSGDISNYEIVNIIFSFILTSYFLAGSVFFLLAANSGEKIRKPNLKNSDVSNLGRKKSVKRIYSDDDENFSNRPVRVLE